MKAPKTPKQITGAHVSQQGYSTGRTNSSPAQTTTAGCNGLTQENYISPAGFGAARVGSISNMSFWGAWV